MHDLTMRCGWCGSTDVEAEYVHNGVGYQQCGPHICATCHAVEISPYNEDPVTDEEKLRHFHMGHDSEELKVEWPFNWDVPRRRRLKPWMLKHEEPTSVWIDGVVHQAFIDGSPDRAHRVYLCCRNLRRDEDFYEAGEPYVSCLNCLGCSHEEPS